MNIEEELLRKYKIEFKDIIPKNYLCIKCNEISIDAHNVPCGCIYCKNCITQLIGDGKLDSVYCIGKTEYCGIEKLELCKNVCRNYCVILEIKKLNCVCPNKGCLMIICLKDLVNHMEQCQYGETICPFKHLGCNEEGLMKENLHGHMNDKLVQHTYMMNTYIDKIKNDMQERISDLTYINNQLSEQLATSTDRIKQLEEEMTELKEIFKKEKNEEEDKVENLEEIMDSQLNQFVWQISYNMKLKMKMKYMKKDELFESEEFEIDNRKLRLRIRLSYSSIQGIMKFLSIKMLKEVNDDDDGDDGDESNNKNIIYKVVKETGTILSEGEWSSEELKNNLNEYNTEKDINMNFGNNLIICYVL